MNNKGEMQIAFVVWIIIGICFILYGIFVMHSKKNKAFGFWANAEMFAVKDSKKYNRALGKLFIGFGSVFSLLGLPLLKGEESGLLILSMIGTMITVIVTMIIYVIVIESKYRKK